ncbi:MAG: hypothetical protein COZ31_02690 [Nitrospirae bacterium CG_4_10_14_3_um_filter_44_29]|nr:hypothetical protein [Nitrospirota bacterium]OIO31111.1 MAG: hypothetical protein AUJ60_02090 [Nitrospirae bacterium CG1_02_44_142]PIP71236.1 MAG: hypothetical protein COW90_01055 [Nitrospirae bacterium CG22_combo_CG10-13_8_21_14_all_44_11]PIV42726.1 MAG: hypothetical protein COS28_03155 [Nitrospirae bacterium CG02_land_8_20_14_3_00_44_33]PIV65980.1 MAG: hypothetical protein COS10_08580 [Nitrospirae bacterium CG01_land_8_20_14_3_00_44_22]PIX89309.1 MAG: hypothetical protein COZ31_02690 [Nit
MKGLKKLVKRFETLMTVAAFAEAGEFETAREILKEDAQPEGKTAPSCGYTSELAVNAAGSK